MKALFYSVIAYAFLMLLFGVCSCNPTKKATKFYNKAKEKHLPTVAKLSQLDWPCGQSKSDTVVTFLPGKTDTITRDQLITVDCPDTARNAPKNSVIKVPVSVPCKCKEKAPDTLYRYITNFEKDPRDSIIFTEQLTVKDKEIKKMENGRNFWRTTALVIATIFFLYILLTRIFKLF
ncbi:hypothetical protein ACTJIJ_19970 [Niabella sp. 22666]|uniref:hypothetical protein n=1 Tax=Niabella sp. 22666 TaxID=3453954 RepID=UPI003F860DD4